MSGAQLILACLLLPAAGAGAVAIARGRARLQAALALVAALLLLASLLALLPIVWARGVPQLFVLEMLPGVALGFRVEPLGMLFALGCAAAWLVACVRGRRAPRAWPALAVAAAIGMAFAANAATLVLSAAVLAPLTRTRPVAAAVSGVVLLCALAATWALAGTLEFLPGAALAAKASWTIRGGLLLLYAGGVGAWTLAPPRHALRIAAGVFAALKILVCVFGVTL